jgi:nucleoid DNA-binding protein
VRFVGLRVPPRLTSAARSTGGFTVTKADLVEEISGRTGISRNHTGAILDHMLEAIGLALTEGKHLEIRGFGTFKVRERRARRARNPRSGTEVLVPAKLVPVFKPSRELKALVLDGAPSHETVG